VPTGAASDVVKAPRLIGKKKEREIRETGERRDHREKRE
jgi:hypothetical protein